MRPDYSKWLKEQQYSDNTQTAQLFRVKRVEEHYGSLDEHFTNGTYEDVISNLEYTANDERLNKPNPSKIKFDGNIKHNLQDYKNAVVRYRKFLNDTTFHSIQNNSRGGFVAELVAQEREQRFSLEKDMQLAIRKNIKSLDTSLIIIDDGSERSVKSGFIDITCEDQDALVIIELKAGVADGKAIGQILGYMGDMNEEEGGRIVKGILIAHDFDNRCKAAARMVSSLILMKYSIEFKFSSVS
jgi:endonuclease